MTGEADALSYRILCDLTRTGRDLVCEAYGIRPEGLAENWNCGDDKDPQHRQRPGHAATALRLRGVVQPDHQRTQPGGGSHSPPTGPPVSGTPPWGFQIVGPEGERRLEPDWEARAMMERIVRMYDLEGHGWATIARRIRADQAAARRHQLGESLRLEAHPAEARARNGTLFARQWSPATCARAARVFWQIVQTEGLDWISDIAVRRIADSRPSKQSPQAVRAMNALEGT